MGWSECWSYYNSSNKITWNCVVGIMMAQLSKGDIRASGQVDTDFQSVSRRQWEWIIITQSVFVCTIIIIFSCKARVYAIWEIVVQIELQKLEDLWDHINHITHNGTAAKLWNREDHFRGISTTMANVEKNWCKSGWRKEGSNITQRKCCETEMAYVRIQYFSLASLTWRLYFQSGFCAAAKRGFPYHENQLPRVAQLCDCLADWNEWTEGLFGNSDGLLHSKWTYII